ncbi:hypothetical protein [Legionella parisiensis]|uniref:CN hydrolase domain-containing protein n=1 Tax=Legionella parisiensis TaxID=45071 RepID=A0A1E5JTW1_9GAMM|nr:hypothetical protein [Legionella parisiensis]KTD43083.1 Carbon-nitrogen hydrolase [Legionella parisiensis]OEH47961.1 hypothetical protein lpari_00985 [Legionella parisiensis]STX77838.1 Carbon-nitrogen hydrolase [Legionella parisiensis]
MVDQDMTANCKTAPEQSNSFSRESAHFKVFVFQPDENFFSSSFEERLNILEKRVVLAKKYLQDSIEKKTNNHSDKSKKSKFQFINFSSKKKEEKQLNDAKTRPPKALFVAPEYLFKDQSELCYKRYYSQAQKNAFKNKLKELSMDTDMLIVPGTFCWYKKAKNEPNNYYRNTAYFFHRGHVEKYKKRHPHTNYDFDYADEGFLNFMDLRRGFFKAGMQDSIVKDFSGMKLGIEICYDSVQRALSDFVNDNHMSLNVQLIIADGAEKSTLVTQTGALFIKVEKEANKTEIGTISRNHSDGNFGIQPATFLGTIEEHDLSCFKL